MQVIWCKRRFETMQIDWRTNIQIWLVKIQENDIKVGVVSLLKALSIYIVHTLFLFSLWMFQLNILMPAGRHPTPQIDGQPSDFLETLHIHPERRSGSSFITLHLAPPWSWRPSISTTTLLKFMWLTRWSTLKPANFEAREGSAHELLFLVDFILLLVFHQTCPHAPCVERMFTNLFPQPDVLCGPGFPQSHDSLMFSPTLHVAKPSLWWGPP